MQFNLLLHAFYIYYKEGKTLVMLAKLLLRVPLIESKYTFNHQPVKVLVYYIVYTATLHQVKFHFSI